MILEPSDYESIEFWNLAQSGTAETGQKLQIPRKY